MRARRVGQVLSYSLRLPDEAQAEAMRLLDASRAVVNQTLTELWPPVGRFCRCPHWPCLEAGGTVYGQS
jgi:putative transposase